MIKDATFKKSHISSIANLQSKKLDLKLTEKVIRAFSLLEYLLKNNVQLIFKGGTALLLLSDDFRRLSIDIDIITSMSKSSLEKSFPDIIGNSNFISWHEDKRQKSSINAPVVHYKFFYESAINNSFGNEPILLDVLFAKSPYPELIELDLKHKYLIMDDIYLKVKLPTVEAILGDKLTAFAPNTTGILYSKNRPVEMIKQLFDVAFLFDKAENFQVVKSSYMKVVEEEIKFRAFDISWEDVLNDTIMACKIITFRDDSNLNFKTFKKGIANIRNFIADTFIIENAIVCASKTAYLCYLLFQESTPLRERYNNPDEIKELIITDYIYTKFNKLKKTNPEAFFYWYKALKINKKV